MIKNKIKLTLYGGLCFPEIILFLKKKESTATQEEQGSERGPKIWGFFRTDFLYCKNRKWGFTKKSKVWLKFPIKNSDFGENLITRGSIYEPFLICVTPSEDPSEVHFFETCWFKRSSKKQSKNMFPENVRNPFLWTLDT